MCRNAQNHCWLGPFRPGVTAKLLAQRRPTAAINVVFNRVYRTAMADEQHGKARRCGQRAEGGCSRKNSGHQDTLALKQQRRRRLQAVLHFSENIISTDNAVANPSETEKVPPYWCFHSTAKPSTAVILQCNIFCYRIVTCFTKFTKPSAP